MMVDGLGATHPIKVGLIGFVPPQIMRWDRRHLEGKVRTRDIIQTAQAYVPEMKEAGADIIIALSHAGISEENEMENASVLLAALEGIEAILTGIIIWCFRDRALAQLTLLTQ